MKIVYLAARLLLGLMFTVFGLNGFLHFIPMAPPPGLAGQFLGAVFQSGFYVLIFGTQAVAGVLLLLGRYVPFALALLASVIANILVFHITMEPSGFAPGLVALVLWVLTFIPVRAHFEPLFKPLARVQP